MKIRNKKKNLNNWDKKNCSVRPLALPGWHVYEST